MFENLCKISSVCFPAAKAYSVAAGGRTCELAFAGASSTGFSRGGFRVDLRRNQEKQPVVRKGMFGVQDWRLGCG